MATSVRKTLVLGGTRCGKSRYSEQLAQASALPVTYIATAQRRLSDDATVDRAWLERIERHQQRRPPHWHCVEEPIHVAAVLQKHNQNGQCLLLDCISLWLTNLLMLENETALEREKTDLIDAVRQFHGYLIMVSNESNMGVLPMGELSRRYCDEIGVLHQLLAASSDHVVMVIAGLPHYLKGESD